MKTIAMVLTITAALSLLGAARPLSVGVPDGSGNVTITIGGTGTQNQTLIAAWANGDKGNDPLDWTEYADAGTVAPSDTSKTFQIPAAWRAKSGAVRFFLMSGEKPYGKRFDYITRPVSNNTTVLVNGGLYIDTGIVPDSTLDLTVKLRADYMQTGWTGDSIAPFGVAGAVYVFPYKDYNHAYYYDFFGAKSTTASESGTGYGAGILRANHPNIFGDYPPRNAAVHEFRLNRSGLYIDGYRHLAFDQSTITGSTTHKLFLFDRSNGSMSAAMPCSIYGATIVTNGVLAAELVPVAAPSGYVEMWDRVTRSWRGRSGSQKDSLRFIAGNDIGPYPPDCGSVETVSDVICFGPKISVASPDFDAKTIDIALSSGHGAGMLVVVAGAADEGEEFASWSTNSLVQYVAANVDAVTFAIPDEWIHNHYNIRFAWKTTAGLPYDYEVAHLHSDADSQQHIFATETPPTTNTTIRVNAKTAYNVCPFGINGAYTLFIGQKSANTLIYYVFFQNGNNMGNTLNGSFTCANPDSFVAQFHDWQLGPGGVFVDDLETPKVSLSDYVPWSADFTVGVSLPFRTSGRKNSSIDTGKTGHVDVRYAKIWEGDELFRDFVPCVSGGVAGFYDNVRGTFYPSTTDKPFDAGAPVVADGDILSWSDVRSLRNGLAIFVR